MTVLQSILLCGLVMAFTPLRGPLESAFGMPVIVSCGLIVGTLLAILIGFILLIIFVFYCVAMLAVAVKTAALKNLNRSRPDAR